MFCIGVRTTFYTFIKGGNPQTPCFVTLNIVNVIVAYLQFLERNYLFSRWNRQNTFKTSWFASHEDKIFLTLEDGIYLASDGDNVKQL